MCVNDVEEKCKKHKRVKSVQTELSMWKVRLGMSRGIFSVVFFHFLICQHVWWKSLSFYLLSRSTIILMCKVLLTNLKSCPTWIHLLNKFLISFHLIGMKSLWGWKWEKNCKFSLKISIAKQFVVNKKTRKVMRWESQRRQFKVD